MTFIIYVSQPWTGRMWQHYSNGKRVEFQSWEDAERAIKALEEHPDYAGWEFDIEEVY